MNKEKPLYQDSNWLYNQYVTQGKTALAISKMCGVHAVTIGKWLNIHNMKRRNQHMKSIEERFWEKVKKAEDNECWEWLAATGIGGYGLITVNKIAQKAHRVSWILHYGEIPDGIFILHKCDNPACVNPDHLFLGTQQDNIQDMVNKKRHSRHESHRSAKLTRQDVEDIIELRRQKISMQEIGDIYNITNSTVHNICQGITWREVTENNVNDIKNIHLGHKFDKTKLPALIKLLQTDTATQDIAPQFGVSAKELNHIIRTKIIPNNNIKPEIREVIKRKRTYLYITEDTVRSIMSDLECGLSQRAIAEKFNLSTSFICALRAGHTWQHITKYPFRPYKIRLPQHIQEKILQLRKDGKTFKQIHDIVQVSVSTICKLCKQIKKPPAKAEG